MNDPIFEGNETGPYEDPRDNFHYDNHLNPTQQYIAWMHLWKKQHLEIHESCKELGQAVHTDEYVKGFMDGVSMAPPNSISLNIDKLEEEADKFVSKLMNSIQGIA